MPDVAIFGSRGYLGRTLVGLLVDHPHVDSVLPVSTTASGRPYGDVVPSLGHLDGLTIAAPDDEAVAGADVAFLATDAQAAAEALEKLEAPPGPGPDVVVDLSRAHRGEALASAGGPDGSAWTYGLAGLNVGVEPGASFVANPGCYPTAALLALAPALGAGLAGPGAAIVDGKSGVSGAGARPRADLHFPETNESLRAYGVDGHDHETEIEAALALLEGRKLDEGRPVRFVPHLVPQNRGLLATAYLPLADGVGQEDVDRAYAKRYPEAGFVEVVEEPDTQHVAGSNRAQVAATADEASGFLVARGAIDNLVKGGAGTAVENMNRALGLDPAAGLPWAGVAP